MRSLLATVLAVGGVVVGPFEAPTASATATLTGGYQVAFQANTTGLWSVGDAGNADTGLGMAAGTSPAIAALPGGGYQMAFQANTTELWTVGDAGNVNTGLGMMPGTSPAIAASPRGGYRIVFQANTGSLWAYSPEGGTDYRLGMAAGTSPAIAALSGGGYQIAFQANTTGLWSIGDAGNTNTALGMKAGTSPAIAASPHGGYRIAFQANTGSLWTYSPDGGTDYQLGMATGTSPAIAALSGGGYQMAFQANTTGLWSVGDAGSVNTALGMRSGTSPAIAASATGGYRIAFQANTTALWIYSPEGGTDTALGMASNTNPTITALATGCGFGRQLPGCWSLSDAGAQFIASFEGFVNHPYNDAAGHCTIGYGHLIHLGSCTAGDHEQWGTITEAEGRELLRQDADGFVANIRAVLPNTPLYQHEFDALVSLSYNIGSGAFNRSSIRSDLSTSPPAYDAVPNHMLAYVYANGQKLCGLYRRRVSEGNLFANGVYERLYPPCPPGYNQAQQHALASDIAGSDAKDRQREG